MRKQEWKYALLLLMFFANIFAFASEKMASQKWHELSANKDYSYRHEIEIAEVSFDTKNGNLLSNFFDFVVRFFASPNGKILVLIVILLIISYAVVRIILNERRRIKNKKPEKKEEEKDVEQILPEDLLESNWASLLQNASMNKDSRLVVRYSYMYLLQLLQQKQLINYRLSKTNYDYFFEIREPELKQYFKLLSRQYEWVWYGNYELIPEKLEQFNNTFHLSLKILKK